MDGDDECGMPCFELSHVMRLQTLSPSRRQLETRGLKYLKRKEMQATPMACVRLPEGVCERHRRKLVNWMCDVTTAMRLCSRTLALSVSIMDRYMTAQRNLPLSLMQLLGLSALMVASKYVMGQDPPPPRLSEFLRYGYEGELKHGHLTTMETRVLAAIEHDCSAVTPFDFVLEFSVAAHVMPVTFLYASYACELGLLSSEVSAQPPSMVASAALLHAVEATTFHFWPLALEKTTTYADATVRGSASFRLLAALIAEAASLVIRRGYGEGDSDVLAAHERYLKSCGLTKRCRCASACLDEEQLKRKHVKKHRFY